MNLQLWVSCSIMWSTICCFWFLHICLGQWNWSCIPGSCCFEEARRANPWGGSSGTWKWDEGKTWWWRERKGQARKEKAGYFSMCLLLAYFLRLNVVLPLLFRNATVGTNSLNLEQFSCPIIIELNLSSDHCELGFIILLLYLIGLDAC